MKKRRKSQSQSVFSEEHLHFRLCHGCWYLNQSNSEVTQCERCHRAFPSQYPREMFAAGGEDPFAASGLMPGNGMEDDEDAFEDESLDDSADFRQAGFGLTGLSVRW